MTLIDRRAFLTVAVTVTGAIMVGASGPAAGAVAAGGSPGPFGPFLRLSDDGTVEVILPVVEMGQGIHSTLAAAVAEELDCDWSSIRIVAAPSGDAYRGPLGSQLTFGSRSMRTWLAPMRKAGATARDLLVRAAAARWQIAPAMCSVHAGVVKAADGRSLGYAALVGEAARLAPTPDLPLKPAAAWRLLGRAVPRKDVPAKTDGSAIYGIDVRLPDMLYAAPRFGPTHHARTVGYDAGAVMTMPGVRAVVPLTRGVAVVADSSWRAHQAAAALPIRFDGPAGLSSSQMSDRLRAAFAGKGIGFVARGDTTPAPAGARRIVAEYETPCLIHAALEPINCTALVKNGDCEVWAPTQAQSRALAAAAHAAGVPRERVTIHSTLIGGGFGRRSMVDYVEQAVTVARAVEGTPVKLTWSRADDSVHDYFRPPSIGRFAATLDNAGQVRALDCRLAAPAIRTTLVRELAAYDPYKLTKGIDVLAPGGISDQPYDFPTMHAEHLEVDLGIETGSWRSIAHSQNCFMLESFMDELATAAGRDPLDYRLAHLTPTSRGHGVLQAVWKAAGWPDRRTRRHLGVSLVTYSNSFAATVVEVKRQERRYTVAHIWCAVDCGPVINPDIAHAQAVGGALFGLSAALTGEATFDAAGRLEQTRFSQHRLLGIGDVPPVTVVFAPTGEEIGGMGEPTVPGIAPALANALFAATGTRIRRLPIARSGLI